MERRMMETVRIVSFPGRNAGALSDVNQELIRRACHGDEEAFRRIFERFARPIMSFLYDMVGRQELAEDLAQETFVRAYRSLKTLRDPTRLSTWLFGIARNVAREFLRSRHREGQKVELDDDQVLELEDDGVPPDSQLLNRELHQVIHRALNILDDDKRVVFTLKVLHEHSYEEITLITGFSIPKLKTDLHRARAEMRRILQPYLETHHEL
jgi:RNA polymerase sigma-70 factor (ECF subfamily)